MTADKIAEALAGQRLSGVVINGARHKLAYSDAYALAEVVVPIVAEREAAALREVDDVIANFGWGDYRDAEGKQRYGAAVLPSDGIGPVIGFRDWLRTRIEARDE